MNERKGLQQTGAYPTYHNYPLCAYHREGGTNVIISVFLSISTTLQTNTKPCLWVQTLSQYDIVEFGLLIFVISGEISYDINFK